MKQAARTQVAHGPGFCYPSGSEEDFINIRAAYGIVVGVRQIHLAQLLKIIHAQTLVFVQQRYCGEILEIPVEIPLDVVDPPIFQELNIDVPTRAAPHRFFIDYVGDEGDYKGENFDELTLKLSNYQDKVIGVQVEDILEDKLGTTNASESEVIQEDKPSSFGYANKANKLDFLGAENFN